MRSTGPGTTETRADPRAPLIPEFLWPWLGWLVGFLVGVTAVFALLTTGRRHAHPLEVDVIDLLRGPGTPTGLWDFGVALGSLAFFGAVVVGLAVWAIARHSWPALVACATVPGAVLLVEQILKPLVDRRYIWGYGEHYYPSGTVAGVAAWTTLIWLMAIPLLRRPGQRLALGLALGSLVLLTSASVVGANRHFPFDAIGGVATGMGVVLACCGVIDRVTGAHRAQRVLQGAAPSP
jgi:membrane-associated phospholipid phosphatase